MTCNVIERSDGCDFATVCRDGEWFASRPVCCDVAVEVGQWLSANRNRATFVYACPEHAKELSYYPPVDNRSSYQRLARIKG